MKRYFMSAVLFVFLAVGVAEPAPYLICDPNESVSGYVLTLDGSESRVPVQPGWAKDNKFYASDPGGGTPCHLIMDLAGVPEGEHKLEIRSYYGTWGVSEAVPFGFSKPTISKPQGTRLAK